MGASKKVFVIGGGPAGSVAAALLAQEGIGVEFIESQHFPRYHIGESITPSTRSILNLIGAADQLDSGIFKIKHGGVIQWGPDHWVIDWSRLFGPDVRSWQVDRAEFDHLLLKNAERKGATVRQGVTVKRVAFTGGRPSALHCVAEDGRPLVLDGVDYLIDASGRTGVLSAQHFRNRQPHKFFRNVAIWGYWNNARLLPDSPIGGINIISCPDGWWWVIPLNGNRFSVGLVTHKETFAGRRKDYASLDAMNLALVSESPMLSSLMEGAEYTGHARVETDYSYAAELFGGPGHFLVGDAACFLDPLLSTGVHLAVYSSLLAAASIASIIRDEVTEEEGLRFFEFSFRRAYTRLLALVSAMYERYEGKDNFFWTADRLARQDAGAENDPRTSASFGEIIAGLSDLREAGDASTRVLTGHLLAEARRVQREAMAANEEGLPDFESVISATPVSDGAMLGIQLVTKPRLQLKRVSRGEPSSAPVTG